MKESKLRSIIQEEIRRLTEIDDDRMMRSLRHDLTKHPAVHEVGKTRLGDITVVAGPEAQKFQIKLKDEDPIDRAPSAADPENWKVTVREKGGMYVNSRTLGQTWGYSDLKKFVQNSIERAIQR
jgi:hypothetical protein